MKLWIGLMLMAGCLGAAAAEKQKTPAAKQANRKAKGAPAARIVVPSDAQQTAPGTWRREEAGKVWIYRETPFGISRFEEKQAAKFGDKSKSDAAEAANMRAFDDGDYVRFERTGPWGVYRWRRKKAELNDVEKQVWERGPETPAAERK